MNKHQALLRASVANAGQDHRLGANEAPPAIISIFLGAELEKAFEAIASGAATATRRACSAWARPVLPPLPMHGGDRNRTSPFAFTGNKFEFRALGSSMSLALPEHGAQHDRRRGDRRDGRGPRERAQRRRVARGGGRRRSSSEAYDGNKQVCFMGDNYSEEWHAEAERRGLFNLRTTPDALPWVIDEQTVTVFEQLRRAHRARARVALRGLRSSSTSTKLNIEAETAAAIARTMILPAAVRHLNELDARPGSSALVDEIAPIVEELADAIRALEKANRDHPEDGDVLEHAEYMRDTVIPAMNAVARDRRPAREARRRRPLAAAEVRGDALHQVARAERATGADVEGPAPAGPSSLCSTAIRAAVA